MKYMQFVAGFVLGCALLSAGVAFYQLSNATPHTYMTHTAEGKPLVLPIKGQ